MNEKYLLVNIRHAGKRWRLPFEGACAMIKSHVESEKKACEYQIKTINDDQWVVSFWSEILGGNVKPPTHQEWTKPLFILDSALSAYWGGRMDLATSKLRAAISAYNLAHNKWVSYRDGIRKGASRSITSIEITIDVLSSAAGAGLGSKASTVAKLAGSATLQAYQKTLTEKGKVEYGLEEKIDLVSIAASVGESVATSLITGKLAEKFLGILAPRLSGCWKEWPDIAKKMAKPGVGSKAQKVLSDFFAEMGFGVVKDGIKEAVRKGKNRRGLTSESFMVLIAEEIANQISAKNAIRYSLAAHVKQYYSSDVKDLGRDFQLR